MRPNNMINLLFSITIMYISIVLHFCNNFLIHILLILSIIILYSKICLGCLQNEYQCTNKCIELVRRCDKIDDCDSGEDEIDCSKYTIYTNK